MEQLGELFSNFKKDGQEVEKGVEEEVLKGKTFLWNTTSLEM